MPTIKINTNELLQLFSLPNIDDVEIYCDYVPDDILDQVGIAKKTEQDDYSETTRYTDTDDNAVPLEAIDRIHDAYRFACESGTQAAYQKDILRTLERCLDTFGSFDASYCDDNGQQFDATVKGIIGLDIGYDEYDETTIEYDEGLKHIIATMIEGYGMFGVCSEDLEDTETYVKDHIRWLKRYWTIYGDRKPALDDRGHDDFDFVYWKELLTEIENKYKIVLDK